jgi:parvulin-like peptidyl-prolyl isomerase
MKSAIKHLAAISLALFVIVFLSGCADITKSSKYETYDLKFLVNSSKVEEGQKQQKIDELKEVFKQRLNKFDTAEVKMEKSEENDSTYITLHLGTIDEINEIANYLQQNDTFALKKKIEKSGNYEEEIKNRAKETLEELKNGAPFETTAQNMVLENPENIIYSETGWMYKDEIKDVFTEVLFEMEPGEIYPDLIEYEEKPFVLAPPVKIAAILKLYDKRTHERVDSTPKQVEVSHILIAFEDAMRASEDVERSKEEAYERADEVLQKINSGEDFSELAAEYSDDLSNKDAGGELGTPAGSDVYVEQFENAALELSEEGEVSEITETPFGYHIIKANSVTEAKEESSMEQQVKFGVLFFALRPAEWAETKLDHEYLEDIEIIYTEDYDPYLLLKFNEEGENLLEQITEQNMDNILGIFAGKQLITSFTVKEVNVDGELKILRPSTTEEADELLEILTKEPLPVPVILKDTEGDEEE